MEIQRIAVIGAGFMGGGIAQVAAQYGFDVVLIDTGNTQIAKSMDAMSWSLDRLIAKGHVAGTTAEVLGRIRPETRIEAAADADMIIEAVFEKADVKDKLFKELDAVCPPETIYASNTSTLPITRLAASTTRPEKVVGMHFFSPVPVNPLLEIIAGEKTSEDTLATAEEVGRRLHKHNVLVKKDVPGFIMNRVFGAMAIEAMRLVETGVGTVEDVDGGLTVGYGMTMGPLAIADLAGLDICLHAFSNMNELDPDIMPAPPAILRRRVEAGKLGRKTGAGFYRYGDGGKPIGPAL